VGVSQRPPRRGPGNSVSGRSRGEGPGKGAEGRAEGGAGPSKGPGGMFRRGRGANEGSIRFREAQKSEGSGTSEAKSIVEAGGVSATGFSKKTPTPGTLFN
jgi:hypothetical protein